MLELNSDASNDHSMAYPVFAQPPAPRTAVVRVARPSAWRRLGQLWPRPLPRGRVRVKSVLVVILFISFMIIRMGLSLVPSPAMARGRHGGVPMLLYDVGHGHSPRMLLPPVAWVFQDWGATLGGCPFLLGVCAAMVAGFLLQHYGGHCLPCQKFAVFYPPTLRAGEFWRLFTHVLLHTDLGHLVVNLLHVLNTLDLESVITGSGYPNSYSLGTWHTAAAALVATAYSSLVASVWYFDAMFEGASALCFGLDGALFGACGLLLGTRTGPPPLRGFLRTRGCYSALHLGVDVLRGCGGGPKGTVGHLAHFAGFAGGLCYVLAALPPLGGLPVPTVPCAPAWQPDTTRCLALFSDRYAAPVDDVRRCAAAVLVVGLGAALFNAFVVRRRVHRSACGYSLFVKTPGAAGRRLGGGGHKSNQL